MTSLTNKIRGKVRKSPLTVNIEKFSAGPRRAKVLFSTNRGPKITSFADQSSELVTAFAVHLGGKGVILPQSIMQTERAGVFSGIVSSHAPQIPLDQASASGLSQVTANVFQDADDNIWTIERNGNSSVLVRQSQDNLAELLDSSAHLELANGIDVVQNFSPASFVAFLHFPSGKRMAGIAVDTCTVFDMNSSTFQEVSSTDTLAVSDPIEGLNEALLTVVNNDVSGYSGLDTPAKQALRDYLTTLYRDAAPEYLRNYLNMIENAYAGG